MAHATQESTAAAAPTSEFCRRLSEEQPEVLSWIGQHLQGDSSAVCVEMAARYFETAARWGTPLPVLKKSHLNMELAGQLPTIDPRDRWMTELPIPAVHSSDRIAIGRLLRALLTVSKARDRS